MFLHVVRFRLIGEVLAWAALEHQLVSEAVANFVSPELTRLVYIR